MSAINTQCPPESRLADFGLGKLDAASAERVSKHLETCADCRQRVANLPGNSFVDLLREAHDPANAESRSLASTQDERGPGDARSDAQRAAPATRGGSAENGTEMPVAFGRYQVTELLGQGGFGVVYLGHDPELQRSVAIKLPRRDRVSSPADTEAYLAEARLLAAVVHPGIVPVHDFGRTDDGLCYVVSEHIPGGDLGTLLARRRLPVEEAVELAAQIAEALHHAHRHGLVHRDIKPGNILLDRDGHPLVADFGLALTDESYGNSPGVFGTPAYMSPEQARGESHRVDARSDIYSLGVLFYEMLAGRRPYRRTEARELLDEISSGDVRPPRQLDHTIPHELERICLKALGHRPADRYTTAFDLADDLRRWQSRGEATEVQTADVPAIKPPRGEGGSEKNALMPRRNLKLLIGCGGLLTLSVTSTVAVIVLTVLHRPAVQLAQKIPNNVAHIEDPPPKVARMPTVELPAPPSDPWTQAKEQSLAVYRLIAIEDPKTAFTWPFAGAVIVGPQALLTTADVGIELANFRARGMNIRILRDSQDTGVLADRVRVHAAFQKAERDERPFFDMAILTTTERLNGAATFAPDAELAAIERGRPLACLAINHSGEPIDRFWPLLPEWQIGKVFAVTRLSSDAGAPCVLLLRGAFSDRSSGSPIFNDRGELFAIYCEAARRAKGGPPESARHYAKVIEPKLIELGVSQAENPLWVSPATAGRQEFAEGVQPRSQSSVAALSNQISSNALEVRAKASYRLIAIEDPKTAFTWPFAGAVIIGPQALLTTADVGKELAKFQAKEMNIKILRDSQDPGVLAEKVRIHSAFQKAPPEEQLYFDLAILSTKEPLTGAAALAADAELAAIEPGQPLACVSIDHTGEPINRFQQLQPEWQMGKVGNLTALSSEAGAPRVLHLRGAFSDKSWGSPIFDERGHLVALYCEPAPDDGGPPERAVHFAALIEPQIIELGLSQTDHPFWVAPVPPEPPSKEEPAK